MAINPTVTETLVKKGFTVYVQENAGVDAKFRNSDYQSAGAKLVEEQEAFSSGKIRNNTSVIILYGHEEEIQFMSSK